MKVFNYEDGKRETRSRLPDGVQTATDAATGRKICEKQRPVNDEQLRADFERDCPLLADMRGTWLQIAQEAYLAGRKARDAEAPAKRELDVEAVSWFLAEHYGPTPALSVAEKLCARFAAPAAKRDLDEEAVSEVIAMALNHGCTPEEVAYFVCQEFAAPAGEVVGYGAMGFGKMFYGAFDLVDVQRFCERAGGKVHKMIDGGPV